MDMRFLFLIINEIIYLMVKDSLLSISTFFTLFKCSVSISWSLKAERYSLLTLLVLARTRELNEMMESMK